jgi:hypothetical protein
MWAEFDGYDPSNERTLTEHPAAPTPPWPQSAGATGHSTPRPPMALTALPQLIIGAPQPRPERRTFSTAASSSPTVHHPVHSYAPDGSFRLGQNIAREPSSCLRTSSPWASHTTDGNPQADGTYYVPPSSQPTMARSSSTWWAVNMLNQDPEVGRVRGDDAGFCASQALTLGCFWVAQLSTTRCSCTRSLWADRVEIRFGCCPLLSSAVRLLQMRSHRTPFWRRHGGRECAESPRCPQGQATLG